MDEEIPYRSPASVIPARDDSVQDEHDYSTLLAVQKILAKEIAEIDSIHVFDLKEGSLTIKQQIVAHRKARFILEPIAQQVNSAIESINVKQERNNG